MLLGWGADIKAENNNSLTALLLAKAWGHEAVASLLQSIDLVEPVLHHSRRRNWLLGSNEDEGDTEDSDSGDSTAAHLGNSFGSLI